MANDWIKMRMTLADDPAVIGIAAQLKMECYAVVGRLHHLWSWADEHAVDGFMPYVTARVIDQKVERKGFAEEMARVGWLIVGPDGVRFPNFDRHNGESAKQRALAMERQRDKREREREQERHATGVTTSRNRRDKSVTREEKRREEYSGGGGTGLTTPSAPDAPTPEAAIEPPPPRRDKFVEESDLAELAKLHPQLDVRAEYGLALRYRKENRGDADGVELRFFAEEWLPRAPVRSVSQPVNGRNEMAEPAGWQAWMDENFPSWKYAKGQEPGPIAWAKHTRADRKIIVDAMKKGAT